MTVCYRCLVSGRVQGVFFRASTQREAQKLGLTGHAHNLPDGTVEVLACGEAAAVEQQRLIFDLGDPVEEEDQVVGERRAHGPRLLDRLLEMLQR